MAQYTKEEAIKVLEVSQAKMVEAKTKDETLAVLKEAGDEVGYKVAFRCLVAGLSPDKAIKWKQEAE